MSRPRLLDLFCGAGGAAVGYHRAGFEVVGVDIGPQPHFPFEFIQGDAVQVAEFLPQMAAKDARWRFDAVHASPPCQRHSAMSACRPGLAETYPDLIGPTREMLERSRLLYVIENVPGAPVRHDLMLCGHAVGLPLYRHRWFESNIALASPGHPKHVVRGGRAGHWKPGQIISVSGNCSPIALAREAMGIDWTNRDELSEAIPPAYTEFVGRQLIAALL